MIDNAPRGQFEEWVKRVSQQSIDASRGMIQDINHQVENWFEQARLNERRQAIAETARARLGIWSEAAGLAEKRQAMLAVARIQAENWYRHSLSSSWAIAHPGALVTEEPMVGESQAVGLPAERIAVWTLSVQTLLVSAILSIVGALGLFWLFGALIGAAAHRDVLGSAPSSIVGWLALATATICLHQAAHIAIPALRRQQPDLRGLAWPFMPLALPAKRAISPMEFIGLALAPLAAVTILFLGLARLIPSAYGWFLGGIAINLALSLSDVRWSLALLRSRDVQGVQLGGDGLALLGRLPGTPVTLPQPHSVAPNFWRGFSVAGLLSAGALLVLPLVLRYKHLDAITLGPHDSFITLLNYSIVRHQFGWSGGLLPPLMLGLAVGALSAALPTRPLAHGQKALEQRAQIETWLPGPILTLAFLGLGLIAAVAVPWTVREGYRLLMGIAVSVAALDVSRLALVLAGTVLLRCILQWMFVVALGMTPRLELDPRSVVFPLAAVPRRGSVRQYIWSLAVLLPALGIVAAVLTGMWLQPKAAPWLLLVLSVHSFTLVGDIWTVRLVSLYPRDVRIGGPGPGLSVYSSESDRRRLRLGSPWVVWSNFLRASVASLAVAMVVLAIAFIVDYARSVSYMQGLLAKIPQSVLHPLALIAQSSADGLRVSYLPLLMVALVVGLLYASIRPPRLLRW